MTSAGNYSWPMSAAGVTVPLPCVFGAADDSSTGNATRECDLMGDWMEPDLSQCRSGFDNIEDTPVCFLRVVALGRKQTLCRHLF